MPRPRGTELPQQQQRTSPRAPLHLRTTNSESNGVHSSHHRSSPKLEDNRRRSPRSPLPEFPSCNQKKRGSSKVTDLETKLGHVQEELKKLREQLASAEAAKKDAQHELEEAKKKLPPTTPPAAGEAQEERHMSAEAQEKDEEPSAEASPPEEGKSTQVDSVEGASRAASTVDPVLEKEGASNDDVTVVVEERNEGRVVINGEEGKEGEAAAVVVVEAEEAQPKKTQEKATLSELEAKLEQKVKELERCLSENAILKKQLEEAEARAVAARTREEEASLKLTHAAQELAGSKAKSDQLGEQLEAAEGAKSSFEAEMKKLKIQTEQWRKAADAAVAALSVTGGLGAEANGRRVAERCGSMDKHLYAGEFSGPGSLLTGDDSDDGWGGGGKRKGAGIRMFGDLWKKKNQQQK